MESGESRSAGYYCHKCNLTVQVPTTDLCPLCNDGFIEKLNPSSISSFADRNDHREDLDSLPAVLRHVSDNFEVIVQGGDSSRGSLSDHRPSSSRRDASSDAVEGDDRRRPGNPTFVNSIEHVFSELLNTIGRPNAGNLDSNAPLFLLSNPPGDYAWGREGLDTIVTQLLNQMDSSGPPPLSNDKIDAIPFVVVTDAQVSENTQCSVCWESFKQAEYVRQLPCEHIYHDACILPWLQLHGTCPICRKLLCDDNDSRLGFSHTGNLEALFSNVQGFSVYPSRSRRNRVNHHRRYQNVRCYNCSQMGHIARDCTNLPSTFPTVRARQLQRQQAAAHDAPPPQQPVVGSPANEGGRADCCAGGGPVAADDAGACPTRRSSGCATRYVDIDELEEEEEDDDYLYDFVDSDDMYSDYGYDQLSCYEDDNDDDDSDFSDFDLDVISFGGSSGLAQFLGGESGGGGGTGWPPLSGGATANRGGGRGWRAVRCFRCNELGHIARDCPTTGSSAGASSSSSWRSQSACREPCRYCARRGHASERCYYKPADAAPAEADGGAQATGRQRRYKSPPPPLRSAPRSDYATAVGLMEVDGVVGAVASQRRCDSPPPWSRRGRRTFSRGGGARSRGGAGGAATDTAGAATNSGAPPYAWSNAAPRASASMTAPQLAPIVIYRPSADRAKPRAEPAQQRYRSPPPPSRVTPPMAHSQSAAGHRAAARNRPAGSTSMGPVCFRCNRPGHLSRDCRLRESRSCHRCGKVGHLLRDCPQMR